MWPNLSKPRWGIKIDKREVIAIGPEIMSAPNLCSECTIVLKTAHALIKGETQGKVRVLFDSESHRSFAIVFVG